VRSSVVLRAKRAPETAISILALVLVVAMVVHTHIGDFRGSTAHGVADEAAMMAAMMMPLAGPSASLVAQRSLRTRRVRSVGEHVAGFTALWFVYGIAAAMALRLLTLVIDPLMALALLLLAAAWWQLSAVRRRRIQRCGLVRTAPPAGWRADVGTTLGGARQAVSCVTTCWASMLAMVAAPHLVLMGTVLAANLSEWAPGPNPTSAARRRRPAAVYLLLAVGTLLLVVARLGVRHK
jgi:predicted metal-binding membrane protein